MDGLAGRGWLGMWLICDEAGWSEAGSGWRWLRVVIPRDGADLGLNWLGLDWMGLDCLGNGLDGIVLSWDWMAGIGLAWVGTVWD